MKHLEQLVLAHRYLYYVLLTPVLSDREYDVLEMEAVELLPEDSKVHDPGSSLHEDYPKEVIDLANKLREGD